jgi:hypothetical protein
MTVAVPDDTKLASDIVYDSNFDYDYAPYEDDEEISRSIPQSEVLDFNGLNCLFLKGREWHLQK